MYSGICSDPTSNLEWDLCYSSDEELDIELDKLLKQMADKTKNNGRW